MNINEAKQILNKSGYLLEDFGGYNKEKRVKFSYLYCLLSAKGINIMTGVAAAVNYCNINFTLDDVNIYIANDEYGSYHGANKSDDTVYFSVFLNDDGAFREKEFNLNTLISLVEKGNFNKIKEIAQEIKNDESIEIVEE